MKKRFKKVAILGLGHIGSSIIRAMQKFGSADVIVGHAPSAATRATAVDIGLVSEVFERPEDAVKGADLVILCAPIGACGALAEAIKNNLSPGAILTDVGSVKGAVVRDVAPHVPHGVHFIPGHPIAGTEKSGVTAAFAELFHFFFLLASTFPISAEEKLPTHEANFHQGKRFSWEVCLVVLVISYKMLFGCEE